MSLNTNELILYRDMEEDETLHEMAYLMRSALRHEMTDTSIAEGKRQSETLCRCVARLVEMAGECGFSGNLWHIYLTRLLVSSINSYSLQTERRGAADGSVNEIVLRDLAMFRKLFDFSFESFMDLYDVPALSYITDYTTTVRNNVRYNERVRERIENLASSLGKCADAAAMKDELTAFYAGHGVGDFGMHKAFRVIEDVSGRVSIEPVRNLREITLNDLVGYEGAKKKLTDNTVAFVEGKKANNCLLYGDAGRGRARPSWRSPMSIMTKA